MDRPEPFRVADRRVLPTPLERDPRESSVGETGTGRNRRGSPPLGHHPRGDARPASSIPVGVPVALSVLPLQLFSQLVEQLGATQLALPGLVGAVEELPLLGVDEASAVA